MCEPTQTHGKTARGPDRETEGHERSASEERAMKRIFGVRKERPPPPSLDDASNSLNSRGDK